jgi:methionyl-tRNA formyltransferase
MNTYVVASIHPWNTESFSRYTQFLPGRWLLIEHAEELTLERLDELGPRYVFFPHWSTMVPESIIDRYECVCFHMTDLPYGRGGSPLQNLIARGHALTKLTALRMVKDFDAGPVYQKRSVLLDGPAQTIYERVALLVWDMITDIVADQPQPEPQVGEVVFFKRRTPAQSELPSNASLTQIYDHIRMLDADGYPHAYVDAGGWRLFFRRARMNDGILEATVRFELKGL